MESSRQIRSASEPSVEREQFSLRELLLLVADVGIALAVTRRIWTARYDGNQGDPIEMVPVVVRVIVAVLSGFAFVGVPLLLCRLTRRRTPWGAGKVAWFSQGIATWLLWPPILVYQVAAPPSSGGAPWSSCQAT